MASGLIALLDDVAAITKLAAASLDDVAAAAGKAGSKAAGIVIDDTAVTPRYVTGFTPDRELPIIAKIARGSLINKLVILLPACLALSAFAPWALTPLLMAGGAFLCFEGAEKLLEKLRPHDESAVEEEAGDPAHIEQSKVKGAIRTDFILSAEIMAISLAQVAERSIGMQAAVLAAVGIAITVGVYGVVGLIVKIDDIGLHLARRRSAVSQIVGRALVKGMPGLLSALAAIGTVAMLWVGGGIIVHGLEEFHLTPLPHWLQSASEAAAQAVPAGGAVVAWLVHAIGSGIVGLAIGAMIVGIHHAVARKH